MKDYAERIRELEQRVEALENAIEEISDEARQPRKTVRILRRFPISIHPTSESR